MLDGGVLSPTVDFPIWPIVETLAYGAAATGVILVLDVFAPRRMP